MTEIRKKIYIVISAWLFSVTNSEAFQNALPAIPFDELTQKPIGSILSIHQGSKTLWLGTENGLLGLTGNHTQQFDHTNSPINSRVNHISQDSNDVLWLSTEDNGVISFDPNEHRFIQYSRNTGFPINHCLDTVVVKNTLYIACNGGIYKIDMSSKVFEEVLASSELYEKYETAYRDIESNTNGELILFGIDGLLYKYIPNTKVISKINTGEITFDRPTALLSDRQNVLWISAKNGEYKLQPKDNTYEVTELKSKYPDNQYSDIYEDSVGDIWFSGFSLYKVNKSSNYLAPSSALSPSLLSNHVGNVRDIAEGINGELYILSSTSGLILLSTLKDALSYFVDNKQEYSSRIQSFEQLTEHKFLFNITEDRKLIRYDTQLQQIIDELDIGIEVYDFLILNDSEVLIVEPKDGLHLLNLKSFSIKPINPTEIGLPSEEGVVIGPMNIDEEGNIYISILGSYRGIYGGSLENGFENIYPELVVLSTFKDIEGNLFYATYNNGVIEYTNDGEWRVWESPDNVGKQPVTRCMTEDERGVIWLCQNRFGLAYLDEETHSIQYIDRRFTLDSDVIRAVVGDTEGFLWVATSKGLVRYDPESKTSISLGTEHGIADSDFYFVATRLATDSVLIAGNGINYIIDTKAANKILDKRLHQVTKTQIMDMQVTDRNTNIKQSRQSGVIDSLNTEQAFNLAYDEFLFTIEFAVNNFIERNQFTFEYRLKGLSDNWTALPLGEGSVTYTTLPSGNYIFEVRAIDARSIAEQPATRLPIKVLPPYWLTIQAYALYIFLILLSFYLIYRYRTQQLTSANIQLEKAVDQRTSELSKSNAQISSLLAQKESLFANVSHEFRTPLTLILGPMSSLRSKLSDAKDVNQFDMMHRNTRRLVQLVEQILELARLDTAVESPKQVYAIDSALGILVNSFKPLAELKGQKLVFVDNCLGGLSLTKDALEKILYNLLSNAIKYSPEDGLITVMSEQKDNQFHLSVQDTGCGIAKEELDTIFERFTRLEKTAEQLGTGLGLAVVKELVKANDGNIHVESKLNQGTTFTVTFPMISNFDTSESNTLSSTVMTLDSSAELVTDMHKTPQSQTAETNIKPDIDIKPVLLIIEDNTDMQTYIKQSIEGEYECMTANNGQQGIELAIEHVPDLIVSDLMMPLKGGFEVVDTLRSNELTAHIPITLLTAKGDDESRLTGWQKTVDDYIAKPFNAQELKLRLSRLLSVRDIVKKRVTHQLSQQVISFTSNEPDKVNANEEPIDPNITPNTAPLSFGSERDKQFYTKLMLVIENNYTDNEFGRKQAADALAVSERQLNRKLGAIVEYNFAELVRKFRLEKAKAILLEEGQIGNVAYDVGFTSPSYFSKCFKAEFGYSPKKSSRIGVG